MREKSYQQFQDFLLSNNYDEEVELYHTRTKTDYGQSDSEIQTDN